MCCLKDLFSDLEQHVNVNMTETQTNNTTNTKAMLTHNMTETTGSLGRRGGPGSGEQGRGIPSQIDSGDGGGWVPGDGGRAPGH